MWVNLILVTKQAVGEQQERTQLSAHDWRVKGLDVQLQISNYKNFAIGQLQLDTHMMEIKLTNN